MNAPRPAQPTVSVIIPVFNKWEYTLQCLQRLGENTTDVDHEVIVVDNGSSDGTAAGMAAWPNVRYQRNAENLGFAKAVNQGARLARGRYLMFLNNDTEPQSGWLSAMVEVAEGNPRVAIVGCKLLFPDGTIQHGGVVFAYASPEPLTPFHFDYRKPADARNRTLDLRAVTAACMLIRPEVFSSVGGLDEAFVNGYEDVDLCLKVWSAGGKIIYTPDAVVTHHESVSDGRFRYQTENVDRLNDLWMERFSAFEVDFRRTAKPATVDPARPGCSVIVVSEKSLATIAPCLENIIFAAGAQDELIVVDNASTGAARRFPELFAARNRPRVSVVRCAERLAMAAAVAIGLRSATRPYVALVDQNVKVVTGWLDRLIEHLRANRSLGAVTASLRANAVLSEMELLSPPDDPDVSRWQPAPSAAGEVINTRAAASATIVAEADQLRQMLAESREDLLGRDPGAFAAALARQGKQLGRAPDVVAYRLNETKGVNDPMVIERVIDCQSAALRAGATRDDVISIVGEGVVTTDDWLPLLIARLDADPAIAAVGPVSNEGRGTPQFLSDTGYANLEQLPAFAAQWTRLHRGEYSFVPRLLPFCLVLRRRHVEEVGGFDPSRAAAAGAVSDLCARLTGAGYRLVVAHDVFVHSPARQVELAFSPQAPPWYRDISKPHRFLLIPDWESPVWRDTVAAYLRAFSSADPVALIMRVEPPTAEWIDAAWGAVNGLLAELAMSPDQSADIVFEGTQRPDAERGGLYTSATAYIRCSPTDSRDYVRQAAACGLPILTAPNVDQLRDWIARR